MRFWCGDYETDEWVLALPVDYLLLFIAAMLGAYTAWRIYEHHKKKKADAEAKKKAAEEEKKKIDDDIKKDAEENAKKLQDIKDAEAKAKAKDAADKKVADDLLTAKAAILKMVDAKLRELQDGHRSTMISDNYNRISWIAEGVRQARDAVESIKPGDVKP